jgi:hypothetical protein
MLTKSFLLIALIVIAGTAQAAGKPFAFAGLGDLSCGKYLHEPDEKRAIHGWWLAGFVSGANSTKGRQTTESGDAEAAQAWVDEYCRTHPLDNFVQAAVKLDEELDRRAKAH